MSNLKTRMSKFLLSAQVMIVNALSDPVIKKALAGYGYAEEKLLAGKMLYDEIIELDNLQKMKYGKRIAATAELDDAWEAAAWLSRATGEAVPLPIGDTRQSRYARSPSAIVRQPQRNRRTDGSANTFRSLTPAPERDAARRSPRRLLRDRRSLRRRGLGRRDSAPARGYGPMFH